MEIETAEQLCNSSSSTKQGTQSDAGQAFATERKASSNPGCHGERKRITGTEAQNVARDCYASLSTDRIYLEVYSSDLSSASAGDAKVRSKRKFTTHKQSKNSKRKEKDAATQREFQAKYQQEGLLGQGGFGSVFAGNRKTDNLPVAIKLIPKEKILCKYPDKNGKQISMEVAIMQRLSDETTGPVGNSCHIALLDWYDLHEEVVLVLERPLPCVDLLQYCKEKDVIEEEEAKVIMKQLADAVQTFENKGVFHRDIKLENILLETGSDLPRVRVIDFGAGCFFTKGSLFRVYSGTVAHAPPEYYLYSTYKPGPTTVWQLGVTLLEILTDVNFETQQFLENKLQIRDGLSDHCHDFLLKCLHHSPTHRATLEEIQRHPWLQSNNTKPMEI